MEQEKRVGPIKGHKLGVSGPGGWTFCQCGAKTPPVFTREAQMRWHREHRREVIASLRTN